MQVLQFQTLIPFLTTKSSLVSSVLLRITWFPYTSINWYFSQHQSLLYHFYGIRQLSSQNSVIAFGICAAVYVSLFYQMISLSSQRNQKESCGTNHILILCFFSEFCVFFSSLWIFQRMKFSWLSPDKLSRTDEQKNLFTTESNHMRRVSQKSYNILVHANFWHSYIVTKSVWPVEVVGSILLVGALTHCTILHFMCDLKMTPKVWCSLIQKLKLYKFELGQNVTEATKAFIVWKVKAQLIIIK